MLSRFQRVLILSWLFLSLFGALNFSIFPAISGQSSFNLEWLPHLRFGHVMFNKNPQNFSTAWFRSSSTSGKWTHISEKIKTPSLGYKQARFAVNFLMESNYLREICARNLENEPVEFSIRTYDMKKMPPLIREKSIWCNSGILSDE